MASRVRWRSQQESDRIPGARALGASRTRRDLHDRSRGRRALKARVPSVNPAGKLYRSVKGHYSGLSIDSEDALTFSARMGVRSINEVVHYWRPRWRGSSVQERRSRSSAPAIRRVKRWCTSRVTSRNSGCWSAVRISRRACRATSSIGSPPCRTSRYSSRRDRASGKETRHPIRHLFLFIGADPNTDWLAKSEVVLDPKGFVLTGADVGKGDRPLETSLPGIFAIGDVRAGSTKRVAAAVGEGAQVVSALHAFLAGTKGESDRLPPS